MKSAPIMTAVLATLTLAASVDAQGATIRTDLDADTRARLELVERMRASRGLRAFSRTSAMPDAITVQAPTVTLTSFAAPMAPPASAAPAVNCIPASIVAPAVLPPPPAAPVQQSTSFQQSMVAGSVGTAPARSLMSRLSGSTASGSRGQVLQSLFDARSLRLYGVAAGTAPVITVTPVVTMTQAPAPAPVPAAAPVCVPVDQSAAKTTSSGGPDFGGMAGNSGNTPGSGNPFLADDLIPSFGPGSSGLPGVFGRQFVDGDLGGDVGGGVGGAGGGQGAGGGPGGIGPLFAAQALVAAPNLVPEPGTLALLGLGLVGLGAARRRRPA